MQHVFAARQKNFLLSLERVITAVASDKYIRQMFEDTRSAIYIPDRVCELIGKIITDDREEEINELYSRISAIEFFFDPDKIEEIENLGMKYINLSNQKNRVAIGKFENIAYDADGPIISKENRKKEDVLTFSRILSQQMLTLGANVEERDVQSYYRNLKEMKKSLLDLKKAISAMQQNYALYIQKAKKKSINVCFETIEQIKQRDKNDPKSKYSKSRHSFSPSKSSKTISLEETIKSLKTQLNISEEKQSKQSSTIRKLNQNLIASKSHIEKLENDQKTIQNINDQIIQENEELSRKLNENKQKVEYLQSQLRELADHLNQTEIDNEDETLISDSTSQKVPYIERQLERFFNEKVQMKNELKEMKNELSESTLTIHKLQSKVSQMTIEKNEILNENESIKENSKIQINKVRKKLMTLNENYQILEKQNEEYQSQIKSFKQTLSELREASKSTTNEDLLPNITDMTSEKEKICKLLNRSVLSDCTKAVEATIRMRDGIQSILNISDQSKILMTVQKMQDDQKRIQNSLKTERFIRDISDILKVSDESEIKNRIRSLQSLKIVFDKLCLEIGFSNDISDSSIPETVLAIQKAVLALNDIMSILNLSSQSLVQDEISKLIEIRDNYNELCQLFNLDEMNHNRILKISKQLLTSKDQYDKLVDSLFQTTKNPQKKLDFTNNDESKFQKIQRNVSLLPVLKPIIQSIYNLCELDSSKLLSSNPQISLNDLLDKIKLFERNNQNYTRILSQLNIQTSQNDETEQIDNAIYAIKQLQQTRKDNETISKLIKGQNDNDYSFDSNEQTSAIRDLIEIRKRYRRICEILNISDSSLDIVNNIREIYETLNELSVIFKLPMSFDSYRTLCKLASSLSKANDKNESFLASLSEKLQKLNKTQTREIEKDTNDALDSLLKIYTIFGTTDFAQIRRDKRDFDRLTQENEKLTSLTGKSSGEDSIKYISQLMRDIENTSVYLGKLIRIVFDSNDSIDSQNESISSIENIPFPIPKALQDKLIESAGQQRINKIELRSAIDRIIDRARSIGFSTSTDSERLIRLNLSNDKTQLVETVANAINFLLNNARKEGELNSQSRLASLEQQLSDLSNKFDAAKLKHKKKISEMKQQIAVLSTENGEREEQYLLEVRDLKDRLESTQNSLESEKKVHAELMELLGGREADSEYLKSKLSAKELLLLAKAEKTRKFVREMTLKKEESARILEQQKLARQAVFPGNF